MTPIEAAAIAAQELAERLQLLATMTAEPGDSARIYLENRVECLDLVELISVGLQFMAVPA